jgi:hypothetical protein
MAFRFPALFLATLVGTLTNGAGAALPDGWVGSLHHSAVWHDNATNADRSFDVLSDLEGKSTVNVFRRFGAGRDALMIVGGRLEASKWARFDGLDQIAAGPDFAWQHKSGLGAYATVFRLEAGARLAGARESDRAGRAGHVAAEISRRLSPGIRIGLRHERARFDAREHAFDRTGRESTATFSADLPAPWRFSASLSRRDGGVLSYASPPHPILVTAGKALSTVSTFDRATDLIAYYFLARTETVRLELSRTLGPRTALAAGFEARDTSLGKVSYDNRLFSLHLLRQF